MGILSRQAIKRRLSTGEIKIAPPPKEEDYDSDAVDVHLGDKVYEWVKSPTGTTMTISLWKSPPDEFRFLDFSREFLRDVPLDNAGIITLRPQTFYLADLRQYFGRVYGSELTGNAATKASSSRTYWRAKGWVARMPG